MFHVTKITSINFTFNKYLSIKRFKNILKMKYTQLKLFDHFYTISIVKLEVHIFKQAKIMPENIILTCMQIRFTPKLFQFCHIKLYLGNYFATWLVNNCKLL